MTQRFTAGRLLLPAFLATLAVFLATSNAWAQG
jgi:hypothetical protein